MVVIRRLSVELFLPWSVP